MNMFPDLEDQFDLNTLIRQCRAGRYNTNNNNNNEMNGVFNMSNYNYTKQAVRALIPNNSTENSSQLVANEDTNTDSDKRNVVWNSAVLKMCTKEQLQLQLPCFE